MLELLEKKAQNGVEMPRRVLFVCTGNTCRSPMAAALLNDVAKGEGILADSAGLYAADGAPMSEGARRALAALDILPPAHAAKNVSETLVREVDVIVAMTAGHAMQLLMRHPDAATKITTFGADVSDPLGGDDACYLDCAKQLQKLIGELFFGEVESCSNE